jgi:DNA-binding transcriptional LysR family regulator
VEWALTGPEGTRRVTARGPVSADDFNFVREAVLAGAGIGLLPAIICAEDVARSRLVRILSPYRGPPGAVHVVWPASRHVPKRVVLVREWLVKSLGTIGSTPTSDDKEG